MFDWRRAQQDQPLPDTSPGTTAYFGDDVPPKTALDPHLFDENEQLRPQARSLAITTITTYLLSLGLHQPALWLEIWITGSSAGYQWAIDADFDLMLGIDRTSFDHYNPDFAGLNEQELGAWLNSNIKTDLWPWLTDVIIGGSHYEMTYFYNIGTGTDVMNISPYTAYDVMADRWVLHPSVERVAYLSKFPQEWFDKAAEDTAAAGKLASRYTRLYGLLQRAPVGSGLSHNAGAGMNLVSAQARALYDDIHLGRARAFQGGGTGNLDWNNFRWQEAIRNGTINALLPIVQAERRAKEQSDADLYGGPIATADEVLTRAMLVNRNRSA